MSPKAISRIVPASFLLLAMALALPLRTAAQQPPHCAQILFCLFNQEAATSDTAGIHKYSRNLIDLILPNQWIYGRSPSGRMEEFEDERLGEDYAAKLADRLARAEQMALTGKGKLVPEANVVRAFNHLMAKVGAPSSLRTDEAAVYAFREHAASIQAFPALFTADRNGTNCRPGEAVFLLYLLIYNNGRLSEDLVDNMAALQRLDAATAEPSGAPGVWGANSIASVPLRQGAEGLVFAYSTHQNHYAASNLFNGLAKTIGF